MKWFKSLKGWQKGAVVLGGIHLSFYMGLLFLIYGDILNPDYGYFLYFLEYPWGFLFNFVGLGAILFIPSVYAGFLGTILYSMVGSIIGLVLNPKPGRKDIKRGAP